MALPTSLKLFLLLVLLLLTGIKSEARQTLGEEKIISFNYTQRPLSFIIKDLEHKYSLNFSYSNDNLPLGTLITCRARNLPVSQGLQELCKCAGIKFQVIGQQIVLKYDPPTKSQSIKKAYAQTLRRRAEHEALDLAGYQLPLEDAILHDLPPLPLKLREGIVPRFLIGLR